MNNQLYNTLSIQNIKKNKQNYFPYILTCILTIMMFYIMHSISINDGLKYINGASSLKLMLYFGVNVVGIFSAIFLFYTNSFLIKRRKKELGLYNILGMEKKHIAKMMSYEMIYISTISLVLGILTGIIFSKLLFLILLKLLSFDITIKFYISIDSIAVTIVLFILIFLVILLFNLAQIRLNNPIELLKGSQYGEKEPKTKWLLVIISIITLGTGYTIVLVVENPMSAISVFFIAVILVIIGTYSAFTAGSIALLKILKKNKNFYYKTKYFISISSMIYRMKQNATGLASICVLSTAVLVILSSTLSLYLGFEDSLKVRYPQDIIISYTDYSKNFYENNKTKPIKQIIQDKANENNIKPIQEIDYRCLEVVTSRKNNTFYLEEVSNWYITLSFINIDEYNKIENKSISLNDDEILIYSIGKDYGETKFNILNREFKVKEELKNFKPFSKTSEVAMDEYYIIYNNINDIDKTLNELGYSYKNYIRFDIDGNDKSKINFCNNLVTSLRELRLTKQTDNLRIQNLYESKEEFLSTYGGLFFIGILFGTLFLIATVLIIYYKQISEGFDDKQRFEIMQKVGMDNIQIKKSIKSQIIIIFFLPLIMAIIHMVVAFKVIKKLLLLFGFSNTILFIICTTITILIFTIIYFIVYGLTAKIYYKIVK